MGVLKNEVGRPSNKTITIRRILKAALLIIVAGGLFLGGYLLNDKLDVQKNITNKEESSKKENLTIKEAKTIFDNIFGSYYMLLSDLRFEDINSDRFKTFIALQKLMPNMLKDKSLCKKSFLNNYYVGPTYEKVYFGCDGSYINFSEFDKEYKKLFGDETSPYKGYISEDRIGVENFEYIEEEDKYLSVTGQGGDGGRASLDGIKEAYKLDNKVYITYLLAECDPLSLETETICNGKEEFKMPLQDALDNKYEAYSDKMEELTFIFFKEDGVYKFEKVIKK